MLAALLLLQTAAPEILPPSPALRNAQARFESVRRLHLPVQDAARGRCDVRIGRFCYWNDSSAPPARDEAAQIHRGRAALLRQLEEASAQWPGHPWIAGQRVRYLIDAGRADSAARLSCTAEAWWCASLRGLALHALGHAAAADTAFDLALARMPEATRCAWTDLGQTLEHPHASQFARAGCAERLRLATLVWRLQQPLWMLPGNEARSEHLSRQTMAVILATSAPVHSARWGGDMRELLLRYGWAESYTRAPPRGTETSWWVVGHDREPSWNLTPRMRSLHSPWIDEDAWSLREPTARSRMAPRSVTALLPLTHQLVRIPRVDSTLIVAAFRMPDESFQRDTVEAALAVLARGSVRVARANRASARIVAPTDTAVVSIEARARAGRRAARARYGIAPRPCAPTSLCLSDLLLFDGPDSASLDAALERALFASTAADRPLGIWWHLRGPPGILTLTLVVEPLRSGIRRTAESLRLARRLSSTRVRWQAPLRADSASSQLVVRLPEGATGRYRVALTIQAPGRPPVTSTREIVVEP